jgi:hypothetical protein
LSNHLIAYSARLVRMTASATVVFGLTMAVGACGDDDGSGDTTSFDAALPDIDASADAVVCTSAAACVCDPGLSCAFTCPDGECTFDCQADSQCDLDCAGGACVATCAEGADCAETCTGDCMLTCAGGGTCTQDCGSPHAGCECTGCT